MHAETEGKAKLTAAWRAAVARMIEAGYNPADVHETMISVGLTGKGRSRLSYMMLVGVAVVGVSALVLFSDLISTDPSAIWRTLSGSQNQTSEQQQEAPGREHEEAERLNRDLAAARSEIEALKAEGARALAAGGEQAERLNRDLVAARSEIEALKAEEARALAAGGEQAERLNRDLVAAGGGLEARPAEGARALAARGEQAERLNRDLVAARSENEALKAEGARALAASGEAVRAPDA